MGIPASEVSYTSAKNQEGDHEVHDGHEVALDKKQKKKKKKKKNKVKAI
jgi:hypothetical protein